MDFQIVKETLKILEFFLGFGFLEIVSSYKYCGVVLVEHLNFTDCVNVLGNWRVTPLASLLLRLKVIKTLGPKSLRF